jgi:hypothetical protein
MQGRRVILATLWLSVVTSVRPLPAQAASVSPSSETDSATSARSGEVAFKRMPAGEVRSRLLTWMAQQRIAESSARAATELWADTADLNSMSAEDSLDRLIQSLALVDEPVRQLIEVSRSHPEQAALNLEGPRAEPFVRDQLRLYHARQLAQHRFYDEALALLTEMDPLQAVDPASLFFYRAVCRLRLLDPKGAADDLTLLLNSTLDVPERFQVMARLMLEEAGRKVEGLNEVARLMDDVERRLDLQRADDPVQQREDDVIAAIDKLLKEMEQQQKQQNQQSDGQGGMADRPSQGAEQSEIRSGAGAEGIADHRELKEDGSWGLLDQQAETKARELIRQQFPSNYLDAISRYTRKIAEQKE